MRNTIKYILPALMLAGCAPLVESSISRSHYGHSQYARQKEFGYFSSGLIYHARFLGSSSHKNGFGFSITFPPFWPVGYASGVASAAVVGPLGLFDGFDEISSIGEPKDDYGPRVSMRSDYSSSNYGSSSGGRSSSGSLNLSGDGAAEALIAVAVALIATEMGMEAHNAFDTVTRYTLSPEALAHGVRTEAMGVATDVSLDVTYTFMRYELDLAIPSEFLNLHSVLCGVKLATLIKEKMKYFLRGGAGLHFFMYSDRPDERAFGVFGGAGLELRGSDRSTIGLDLNLHYLPDEISENKILQLGANYTYYF